jgi:HlyD family secretion protein
VRQTITALCVGTLVIGLSGCSDDDSGIRLGTVGRSTVTEVVEAPATVTAKATAEVTSAADGRITELRVREGQAVRAGRILLRIGSPRAERQLRDARRADAEAASAGSVAVPSGGLTSAQRRADADARAAFAAARRSARQIADRQVRAQALAAVRASEAQYAAARAQAQDAVRQFNAGLGSLSTAIGSLASAQRVQTRAAVAAAQRTVDALTIRAPITGRVSLTTGGQDSGTGDSGTALLDQLPDSVRGQAGELLGSSGAQVTGSLAEGQPVRSGQLLLRVTDASALTLAAQVDETDVLLVEPGVVGKAELDAVPDATYDAEVTTIDPTPSTSSRGGVAYTVRLSLGRGTEEDGTTTAPEPRPGMSAVVDLMVRTATDAVAVPASAVFRDGRRDAVWVVRAGMARKQLVQVGAQGEDEVQIVEGLKGGERIVVRGADRVRDGQRVQ